MLELWSVLCRIGRWLFYCVVLALIPMALHWLWLPEGSTISKTLEHGELALVAAVLAGAALDVAMGQSFPPKTKNLVVSGGWLVTSLLSVFLAPLSGEPHSSAKKR
jgi:hypothetical protein